MGTEFNLYYGEAYYFHEEMTKFYLRIKKGIDNDLLEEQLSEYLQDNEIGTFGLLRAEDSTLHIAFYPKGELKEAHEFPPDVDAIMNLVYMGSVDDTVWRVLKEYTPCEFIDFDVSISVST